MNPFFFWVAFFALLYASFTDLKSKLVPDNLVYGLIFFGFLFRVLEGFLFGWSGLVSVFVGAFLFFLVGFVFYRFRGWADGDFGLFVGLSFFLPSSPVSAWPVYFSFVANMALVGVSYAFLYTLFLAFRPGFFEHWSRGMSGGVWLLSLVLGLGCGFCTGVLGLGFVSGFLVGFLLYPLRVVSGSLDVLMRRWVSPDDLEVGDWVLEDVVVGDMVVVESSDPGLSRGQIRELQELCESGELSEVLVKDGIPFVPVFFLSYVVTVVFGDVMFWLVSSLVV